MQTMTTTLTPEMILTKEGRSNPQAIYALMREQSPAYHLKGPETEINYWFITHYEHAVAALKDARIGKEYLKHLPPETKEKYGSAEGTAFEAIDRHLLNIDPPDHTRLRGLVHKAFTPRLIESLRPRIQTIADTLLDDVIAQGREGEIDLIEAFGFPLPIIVIAELLGVPPDDREKFRAWTKAILFGSTAEEQEAAGAAAFEFMLYMHNLIDERSEQPRDDLLSGLVAAEEEGVKMDRQELLSMIFLLLVAGHETTVNLIANGTLALLQHPEQMALLRARPELMRPAIEEMLRYNGPVETTTIRFSFDDIPVGNVVIPKGDIVMVALHGANRDPAVFAHPDVFEITRDPNRHIAFGNGIHFCLGAPLARMEGMIAMETLLRRVPHLHMTAEAEAALSWNDSLLLHGMKGMPVQYRFA